MEHWVEINLDAELAVQDSILLDVLRPYVRKLGRRGDLVTYHYFREPEIRFRVRLKHSTAQARAASELRRIAVALERRKLVSGWRFGSHGEQGKQYVGEEDRYGRNGWVVAQEYFRRGAETALDLLELKRRSKLESPLWAKGLGNPWEGGRSNPWTEVVSDPLAFHWSRYVHLFSNQVGFDMVSEARLASKQSDMYREVHQKFGMSW